MTNIDPNQIKADVEQGARKSYNLYKSVTDLIQTHPKTTFWLFLLIWIATVAAGIRF